MDSDEEEGRSEIQMKSSKKKDKRYVLHVYGISFPFDYITLLAMQKRRQRPKQWKKAKRYNDQNKLNL